MRAPDGRGRHLRPAARLQLLPEDCWWSFADSGLLQAIARGEPAEFGKRGARLRTLVGAMTTEALRYRAVRIVGMLQLCKLLARQRQGASARRDGAIPPHYPPSFFVGFGAGSEEALYDRYVRTHPEGVGRIDQTDVATLGAWHIVGVREAFGSLDAALQRARAAVLALPPEYQRWRLDFLTSVGIRVAPYAFMRAWCEKLRKKYPSLCEVAFLAADTPAFAAVDAGLPTRCIQHGMIRHSLMLPAFTWVDALTPDEATHFRQRLPSAEIAPQSTAGSEIAPDTMSRGILVASGSLEGPICSASRRCSTGRHRSGGMCGCARTLGKIDRSGTKSPRGPASGSRIGTRLSSLRCPASVRDWSCRGTPPRWRTRWRWESFPSVSAADDPDVADMVYPLYRRCLRWPDDRETIERALVDDDAYRAVLARLRSGWNGESD